MKNITVISVFLASPMDVVAERNIFREALERINQFVGRNLGFSFEVSCWEDDVLPDAGADAQDVVNSQISRDYDIFVALFKDRTGTKTHRAVSGTVEEYELALMKRSIQPELKIMCYYFGSPDNDNDEIRGLKQRMNNDGVLYTEGNEASEFEDVVFSHFSRILIQYAKKNAPERKEPEPGKEDISVSVALMIDQKVVIVKRSAASSIGAGIWQIPGGKVREEEKPVSAARREILEELGIELDPSRLRLISDIKRKNIKKGGMISMQLYRYDTNPSVLEQIVLNGENDRWDLLDLSGFMEDRHMYLGDTKHLLSILWREIFLVEPLECVLEQIEDNSQETPSVCSGSYPQDNVNMLYAVLSVLGLVRFGKSPELSSKYSKQIIEEIISLSRNNMVLFENTNIDILRSLNLPAEEYPVLQKNREKMMASHKALMSVLSCRVPLKNSIRNVADVLFFGEYKNDKYILMRWDFYANKYQLISGGVDGLEYSSKEEKAAKIIKKRLSDRLFQCFDYHEMARIQTNHFSAGSIQNDPILRKYNVDVIAATPKKPMERTVTEAVDMVNSETAQLIEYSWDISPDDLKKMNYFQWISLESLLASDRLFENKKVQGIHEIINAVGKPAILECADHCVALKEEDIRSDIDELITVADSKVNGNG